jgi:hypothetical protein
MKTLAFVTMILASVALSSTASARNYTIHGTICRPEPANIGNAEYDQYGVHNTSTTSTLTVECPLPLAYPESGPPPLLNEVDFTVYTRNRSQDVECAVEQVDADGNTEGLLINRTFNQGPGSGPIVLPIGPGPILKDGSGMLRLRCTIAPVDSGWFSHVTSIFVQTSE